MEHQKLYDYILTLGDNSLILGHRLSELCGHGPSLETDIALTNISLDLYGQVRNYFQYAAELAGDGATEDSVALLRIERAYRNTWIVEQPNEDFAHVICRQFLFDSFHMPLMQQLCESKDERISAIAKKSIKEASYHERFSSEWMKRLGGGTEVSNQKMQAALNHLYPFVNEFFQETDLDKEMKDNGIGADLVVLKNQYFQNVNRLLEEAELIIPEPVWRQTDGKLGFHSEHLGFILAELQYMQRAYPDSEW
ncbi:MAG: 1,2-phenylacetyl-CoA epoxidase subunit PaaC [Flavobacteriales bacterium]